MDNPFNVKNDRQGADVFSGTLITSNIDGNGNVSASQVLVDSGMPNGVVTNAQGMVMIHSVPGVVFPSINNNADQVNNQDQLENEIGEGDEMYGSLNAPIGSVILPYSVQQSDANVVNSISISAGMPLIDINENGKKRLENTLVGKIIEILRQNEKDGMTVEDIQKKLDSSFDDLRKADGTKYKGDRLKAITGALYSTGIFRQDGKKWYIKPAECEKYENHMRKKLESKTKRKTEDVSSVGDVKKRKYTKKQVKKTVIIELLKKTSDHMRTHQDRKSEYFRNPFSGMTGTEEISRMRKKLGDEKFEMAIQMYNFFEEIFNKALANEDDSNSSVMEAQTSEIIKHMQSEIDSLSKRIRQLESNNPSQYQ